MTLSAYLHHGRDNEPRQTESVDVRESLMPWQARGLSYTATGYGARIPTGYMVRFNGRWRRVYCATFGNAGSTYIGRALATGIICDVWRD